MRGAVVTFLTNVTFLALTGHKRRRFSASILTTYAADFLLGLVFGHGLWCELYDSPVIGSGGGLMNSPELVLASFRETVAKHIWGDPEQVDIVVTQHPNDAGLIGAAALFQ